MEGSEVINYGNIQIKSQSKRKEKIKKQAKQNKTKKNRKATWEPYL